MKRLPVFPILIVLFLSCKKNQLGGKSTIKGTVVHHSRFIAYSRVFIKFNATELPGTDTLKYDSHVTADEAGNYQIKCYKGDYYLLGYGYDDQLKKPVYGGTPVHIRNNENLTVDVGVTEDH